MSAIIPLVNFTSYINVSHAYKHVLAKADDIWSHSDEDAGETITREIFNNILGRGGASTFINAARAVQQLPRWLAKPDEVRFEAAAWRLNDGDLELPYVAAKWALNQGLCGKTTIAFYQAFFRMHSLFEADGDNATRVIVPESHTSIGMYAHELIQAAQTLKGHGDGKLDDRDKSWVVAEGKTIGQAFEAVSQHINMETQPMTALLAFCHPALALKSLFGDGLMWLLSYNTLEVFAGFQEDSPYEDLEPWTRTFNAIKECKEMNKYHQLSKAIGRFFELLQKQTRTFEFGPLDQIFARPQFSWEELIKKAYEICGFEHIDGSLA